MLEAVNTSVKKANRSLNRYVFLVVLAGVALAGWLIGRGPYVPATGADALTALIWIGLVILVDASPMPLPRGGATASVSSVLDFAAIIVFGPAAALEIGMIAVLISRGVIRRDPISKLAFNASQIALSIGAAALIYTGLGGPIGESLSAGGAVLPLFPAAVAYFFLNTFLVSVAVGLSERLAWGRIWQSNFQWEMTHLLAFLPLGLLVGLVQEKIGIWGVLLLFIQLIVIRYTFQLYLELREANRQIVSVLASAIDARDPYTHDHSRRISENAVRVAREMRLPERQVEVIHDSALLHDMGKIRLKKEILEKPAALSEFEKREVRMHPTLGGDMLGKVKLLREVEKIVASHHERPDGLGYPRGLKENQVPIGARIVGVLDAFDAMTSDRPYRKALPPQDAIAELVRGAGKQFDERVVLTVKRLFETGDLVMNDADAPAQDASFGVS